MTERLLIETDKVACLWLILYCEAIIENSCQVAEKYGELCRLNGVLPTLRSQIMLLTVSFFRLFA